MMRRRAAASVNLKVPIVKETDRALTIVFMLDHRSLH